MTSFARGIGDFLREAPNAVAGVGQAIGNLHPLYLGSGIEDFLAKQQAEFDKGYSGTPDMGPGPSTTPLPPTMGGPPVAAGPKPFAIEEALAAQMRPFPSPQPPPQPRGQVNVTIGGKTYDYAQGESIPDAMKGRMGPITEPQYAITEGGATLAGQRQFGGQGGRGSASMVELSDDSTTPMADQLRREKLQRTLLGGAQAEAEAVAADPFGAERSRHEDIETGGAIKRGEAGVAQAVEKQRRIAEMIAQQDQQEQAQIDMDANRDLAQRINQLHQMPAFQNAGLSERMEMEQKLRAYVAQQVEQQKREATVNLYSRYGIVRPTMRIADPNDPNAITRQ